MTIVFQQVFCARELHERCFPLDITRIAFARGINHLRKQVYYDSISHWAQHLNWTSVGRSKYVKTQSERQLDVHWTYRRILNVQWTFSLGAVPSGIYIYIYIYIYIPLLRIKAWILVWICSIPTQLEWTHPLVLLPNGPWMPMFVLWWLHSMTISPLWKCIAGNSNSQHRRKA